MGAWQSYESVHTKTNELKYMLTQCEDDLRTLNRAASTIKETIDVQYEVIQNGFNQRTKRHDLPCQPYRPDEKGKHNHQGAGPMFEELNKNELQAMASMQNTLCIQSSIIQHITGRLDGLVREIRKGTGLSSSVDSFRSQTQEKRINTGQKSRTERIDSEFRIEEQLREREEMWQKIVSQQEEDIKRLKQKLERRSYYRPQNPSMEISGKSQRPRAPRLKVSVVFYTPRKGEMLSAVMAEITSMLTNQFDAENTDLNVIELDTVADLPGDVPIIVMCINASRLGTDVSNALQGLTANPQTAVLILHHKEIHAQPNQASDRVLTSADYKSLGGIFDMAFLSRNGVYPCDMNNSAVSALLNFIRQKNFHKN